MVVTLSADVLNQYRRFSLYNSPFVAHDDGRAIDLYPESGAIPSPVTGEVLDVTRVRAPPRPYAADHDWLILVDAGDVVARVMHVDPAVEPGDRIEVGEPVGTLVRAGFFAPWVPNHLHLEFRDSGADPYRASGSVRLDVGVDVTPLAWDGTGTVVETGDTWARLDAPSHPDPGNEFVGLATDTPVGDGSTPGVLDGGLPHYDGGGLVGGDAERVALAGTIVGTAAGRDVEWDDVRVLANGDPVTGLALFCSRDRAGVKLVGEDVALPVGTDVRITIERRDWG